MAKAEAIRSAKREKTPFSASPAEDEVIEVVIPEGADSGKIPSSDKYIGQLLGLVYGESENSGNPMITWTFTVYKGEFRGMDFNLWTTLTENSMWKLGDTLAALGVKYEPGIKVKIDPTKLKGTLVRMKIVDDKWEGRDRSKLAAVLPHPDGAGTKATIKGFKVPAKADEDEEEEAPRRSRKQRDEEDEDERPTRSRKARDEDDDEDEDEDERPTRSRRAAKDEDEDEDEDERPAKRGKKSRDEEIDDLWPKTGRKGKKVRDEEDDEDDEEERPRRSRKAVDEDEDEDEDDEYARPSRSRGKGPAVKEGKVKKRSRL
ncbi:MAG TPA: hypothetical protein VJ837_06450 [Candidatus Paceibacterota bacterium]|nr:hypothetical protein [Candidatus Paceibacterota bacterium]